MKTQSNSVNHRRPTWAPILLCGLLLLAPLAAGSPLAGATLTESTLTDPLGDPQPSGSGLAWSNENAPAGAAGWGMGGSSEVLVMSTLGDGTFQSRDNGQNWEPFEVPIIEASSANGDGFAFDPQDPQLGFVCGFGGVARTTNGGQSWEHLIDNPSCRVSAIGPDGRIAVSERTDGFNNRIVVSDDRGDTWNDIGAPIGSAALYGMEFGPTDDHLVVASIGTTWATANGGETWTQNGEGVRDMTREDDGTIWRTGFSVFQKSTDGGQNWQDVDFPSNARSLGHRIGGGLYVTAGDGVFLTRDGGTTWQNLGFADITFGTVATMADPHDPDAVFLAHEGLGVVRIAPTGDGDYFLEGRTNGFPNVDLLSLGTSQDGLLLLAGGPLGLFASHDGGANWAHTGGGYGFRGVYSTTANTDGSVVYAGGQTLFYWPFLMYSHDAGLTWGYADIDIGGDGNVLSVVAHPEEPQTAYAVAWGELTDSQVLKTTDGGATWEPILATPVHLWDATWNTATDQLLVATDNGILAYSETTGWSATSASSDRVRAVDSGDGVAYAGILAGQLWRTPGPVDLFLPWALDGGGAPAALAAHPDAARVFSVTQDGDVYDCQNFVATGTCTEDTPPEGDFKDTLVRRDGGSVMVASQGAGLWTAEL